MDTQNFRDLRVWQLGMQLAEEVYRVSEQFPKAERYGLVSQIQRAAVSIPANIAEGHATGSTKQFLRFLGIAQGSLAELETQLVIAGELKMLERTGTTMPLLRETDRILQGLIRSL